MFWKCQKTGHYFLALFWKQNKIKRIKKVWNYPKYYQDGFEKFRWFRILYFQDKRWKLSTFKNLPLQVIYLFLNLKAGWVIVSWLVKFKGDFVEGLGGCIGCIGQLALVFGVRALWDSRSGCRGLLIGVWYRLGTDYNSIKPLDFPEIFPIPKILSLKLFGDSWGNSLQPLLLITTFYFICGERKIR